MFAKTVPFFLMEILGKYLVSLIKSTRPILVDLKSVLPHPFMFSQLYFAGFH
jgi:hypothetical protein